MLKRKNAVVFIAAWNDACALWRLYMPHLAMPGSSFFCFGSSMPDLGLVLGNDTLVVQRCCSQAQLEFILTASKMGMKVIYDLDDDVWDLPEYNPAHGPLKQARQGFSTCIRFVDAVTVSTRTLRKAVIKNVKEMKNARTGQEIPVIVVENKMLLPMFVEPVKPERPTIGWAGSSSHIGDLPLVEDAILSVCAERPETKVQFRGCAPDEKSALRKLKNFEFKMWTPVAEFASRMPRWGWSIALAPVTDHPFNSSKSCIKVLEAAYCGIPCLASWVRPYEEFAAHDPELQWLLCAGASNFKKKLRELVFDDARREELGRRSREALLKHYSLDLYGHPDWQRILESI